MKVDIQRKLLCRSDRVKCVDLHPTEPWLLTALYSGQVHIWHTTEATLIKSFEVSSSPIRVGKFIARKSWIVTGSDDLHVRIFNYNTTVKIADFEAHDDFIRSALVHPILNVFITASDDTFIKVWDWDKNFECVERFEGHTNFIMQVTLNPKDNSIFASASLDKTVKVWQIGNKVANFTLVGHEQGVNCVDFYPGDGRPYLASGSDDWQIRIWDYLARSCVSVLKGHSNNVNAVIFAARGLPLLYSGSEDDTIKAWNVNSFKCESTVTFGLGRCWTASTLPKRNSIAVGFDEGSAVLAIGNEEPLVSMDDSGKVVRAQGVDVYKAILNLADAPEVDEAPLKLEWTHITTAELYPQKMEHSPNGRFVAVSGDDEWMICTASAFRNKAFGHGKEFAWAAASVGSNVFGVVDGQSSVRIYRNFNEDTFIKTEFPIKGIDGGPFLTVRSANFVSFYDWSGELIENVEFSAVKVYWNEDGTKVAVAGKSTFFILNYNTDSDDTQFTPSNPYPETVTSALWIEGCFVFTTSANSIQYIVSGDKQTVAHFDRAVLLVRFFPKSELLALTDFEGNVYIRTLPLSLIRYQLAVEASDFDHADALLASIPNEYRAKLGRYLEKLGFKKQALAVSDDQEHRFELAIGLNLLNTRDLYGASGTGSGSYSVLSEAPEPDPAPDLDLRSLRLRSLGSGYFGSGSLLKIRVFSPELTSLLNTSREIAQNLNSFNAWRTLAKLASELGAWDVCIEAYEKNNDYGGLLTLATCNGSTKLLEPLSKCADANIRLSALMLQQKNEECIEVLIELGRIPEAAFFAHTYCPSQIDRCVGLWRSILTEQPQTKLSKSIADPATYPNLFPDFNANVGNESQNSFSISEDSTVSDDFIQLSD